MLKEGLLGQPMALSLFLLSSVRFFISPPVERLGLSVELWRFGEEESTKASQPCIAS